jgi:putative chitinase
MITKQILLLIDPAAKTSQLDLDDLATSLNKHFGNLTDEYNFSTPKRQAAFLAQAAYESQHFQRLVENLNYSVKGLQAVYPRFFPDDTLAQLYAHNPEKIANLVYSNMMGNGGETSGDGWKYKGRGLIQQTGKWMYEKCGAGINQDLVNHPEYLESVEGAVQGSIWFWNFKGLNAYADNDNFIGITRIINPGLLGLQDRENLYQTALEVLTHI